MATINEKIEKFDRADDKQALALLYEWTKTSHITKSEFAGMISHYVERFSRDEHKPR